MIKMEKPSTIYDPPETKSSLILGGRKSDHSKRAGILVENTHGLEFITLCSGYNAAFIEGKRGDMLIDFTSSEFKIFSFLLESYGLPQSREDLLDYLDSDSLNRLVNAHVKSVRSKLKEYGNLIKTVRGFGYVFDFYGEDPTKSNRLEYEDFGLDLDARIGYVAGKRVTFTLIETGILALLAKNPGRVYSRAQIARSSDTSDHNVKFCISEINAKIPAGYIENVFGSGYKFTKYPKPAATHKRNSNFQTVRDRNPTRRYLDLEYIQRAERPL